MFLDFLVRAHAILAGQIESFQRHIVGLRGRHTVNLAAGRAHVVHRASCVEDFSESGQALALEEVDELPPHLVARAARAAFVTERSAKIQRPTVGLNPLPVVSPVDWFGLCYGG